ncbi:MAG: hypothetical protein II567_05020, partial [Candidatus Riflebacteria bacterium]|nr:hypothetical protein [Candidatus Riflebacteria bacterium]
MFRLSDKSVKYILFLILTLLTITNSAFALQQLTSITGNNWNNTRLAERGTGQVSWSNYTTYYRINGSTNNQYSEGFRYHTFNIPGDVNAKFSWIYSPYATTNRTFEMSFRYGPNTNSTNDDVSVLTYNSTTSNTNEITAEQTVAINAGNYYAKAYYYGYRNAYARYYSLLCNISPHGLAANLTTTNRNIGGTNFNIINGINLTWNQSTSTAATLKNYNIYRSTTSGSNYIKIGEVAANAPRNFLDVPETAGTYYYVITDVDTNDEESPHSKEVSINSPGVISGLRAEVVTPNTPEYSFITLNCNTAPGNIYFFRGTTSGNYNRNQSWGNLTTVNDENGLEDDTLYYYTAVYVFSYTPLRYSPLCHEISVYFLKPPQNLTANFAFDSNNLQEKIVLNWSAKNLRISNLQSYTIYRSDSLNGNYVEIGTVDASTRTFSDINVIPGATYYYKISCTTNIGSSGLSFPVSAYVSKPPSNLTANMISETRVDLSWTAPNPTNTNHNGFYIYRGLTPTGPFTQIGQVWNPNVTYTDTDNPYGNRLNIDDGDCIYYVVADFNYTNEVISGYSNVAKASKLFPPTNLTAALNGSTVTLNWQASTCPANKLGGYYIYRSDTSGGPYTKIGSVEGNTLTFTDTTAQENSTSYYVVTTYNKVGGESNNSNEANCFIPSAIEFTVSIDSSVSPEIVLDNSDVANIPVNWTINSSISGITINKYTVTIYKSDGTSVQSSSTTNSSATSHTVANVLLRNAQSYYASVELYYTINGLNRSKVVLSSNSFTAITPQTMNIKDGWSGKDIAYSFFDNRVEACWQHDVNAVIVKYEAAVGTTPYGSDIVDWHDIGLTNRIAITTPELASGTRYFTSVRG